jgi:hypothetical protein
LNSFKRSNQIALNHLEKKSLATFILLGILAFLPMSCNLFCRDSCGCGPTAPRQFLVIKSFEILTLNENRQEVLPTLILPYNQVFKAFSVKDFEFISLRDLEYNVPFTFGTAYACSPIPPGTKESLFSIQVINQSKTTLGDGTSFEIGENITPYFGMNNLYAQGLIPVSDFIGGDRPIYLEDNFKLGFTKNPEKEIKLEFTIRLLFDNGKEFLLPDQTLAIR